MLNVIKLLILASLIFNWYLSSLAQSNAPGTNGIQTYVNPVLPGDHPDQTMMRIGKDFYTTGSNFHFTPYLPILHSTDMMHWEVVAKVIPANSSAVSNDKPQAGTWQGALAEFGGKYWVYYSNNAGGGQYFCNATNMKGPWSAPVKVATNTGVYGYDNSIFVDDDGTPYMLLKNGQDLNGLQKLNPTTGQPNGQAINMNWVNSNGHPYSWAEGPVMCKRNGRYYMFVAGNVVGGQYTLSTADITSGESGWTRHGNFWSNAASPAGFTGPNHITQPIKLDDGTWWCLSHAYDNAGWNGQGRQSHLNQVIWDASNVPHGVPINSNPVLGPNLPSSNIPYDFGKADYFESTTLKLDWHFYNKSQATKYSLSERPGYMRLKPGTGNTYILQKDKGKVYSLTTKVDLNATANGQEAGLRMMNGWDDAYFNLYIGYNGGKKIGMDFNGTKTEVNNSIGNTVWLRIERNQHILTTFYSADGLSWTQLGTKDVTTLDASQHDYNAWVGTSVGLYSSNINADFDMYSHRFGFVPIKAEGRNNWYGTSISTKTPGKTVTNGATGDWMMLAGVDLGLGEMSSGGIEVNVASANSTSSLEVWMDNIGGSGTKLTTIAIPNTGGADVWKNVTASFNTSGQHDIYLRFIGGSNAFFVNTIRCLPNTIQEPFKATVHLIPGKIEAEEYDLGGEGVAFHEGNTNGNEGKATLRNDEVDIENCTDLGGGYNIGYSLTGEWLEYSVNVSATAKYTMQFRVAKDGTGGLFHAEIDGVNVTGSVAVPNTGGWQMWQTVEVKDINLTAGTHILKIVFDTDYTNFNYVEVKSLITNIIGSELSASRIYPNPFSSEAIFEKAGLFDYEIFNNAGVLLQSGIATDKLVFGSALTQGVYHIHITQNGKQSVKKIIKL